MNKALPLWGAFFCLGCALMKLLNVNGVERQFSPDEMPATLSELLQQLDIEASVAVAEIEGVIVRPEDFARTQLTDGQSIELVRFVGGG